MMPNTVVYYVESRVIETSSAADGMLTLSDWRRHPAQYPTTELARAACVLGLHEGAQHRVTDANGVPQKIKDVREG